MKKFLAYFFGTLLAVVIVYFVAQSAKLGSLSFTRDTVAVGVISPAAQNKIHVLIVPGHEPSDGGTQFDSTHGMLYERDMTVELGQDLQSYLQNDAKFQVDITRDTTAWSPVFASYFQNNWNAITAWEQAAKANYSTGTAAEELDADNTEIHNNAAEDVALRLYGITKWSNENNVNLMIHIHFNNYPGSPAKVAGKYSGMVMYIPAPQYANSVATAPIAKALFNRLSLYNPLSNLPVEAGGIIADPELIATGAYNTANMPSILIEYEYIYEPQLTNPATRSLAIKDLAYQTYLGLKDYFNQNPNVSVKNNYNPSTLYAWNGLGDNKNSTSTDIYALQTALIMDGDYPPAGKTKNDCPHSGTFGACTESALAAFQNKNGITGEKNIVGQKSFDILNNIYTGQTSDN